MNNKYDLVPISVTLDPRINVNVKKLHPFAIIPEYQTSGAAGFDFHATEHVFLAGGETKLIPTGLCFSIPCGFELQVRPRSGLSLKTGLRVVNSPGTIDSDFRGEVMIIMQNTDMENSYTVEPGQRIAQGVLCPVYQANFNLAEELDETERGNNGFGSTGA